ncbi:MAG: circadian clock protein KaiB [Gammaproteobacteria bacterium]|nr:circadian clock protein KaiB [Gammaproteobacteria bacterium]MCP5459587.1 circadian clock protein KaiB [Gammaproteobacteria bacterium]
MSDELGYQFKLYISGEVSASSLRAIANFDRIRALYFQGECQVEIIDIHSDPERAIADRIIATPTLVKVFPPPRFKIVGDLSKRFDQVSELLSLARND